MKSINSFSYTVILKPHQSIAPGEVVNDNGVMLKVLGIQKAELKEQTEEVFVDGMKHDDKVTGYSVIVTLSVEEIPNNRTREGRIILDYCEICAGIGISRKLSDLEKMRFGNECQECVEHTQRMFDRMQMMIETGKESNGILWTKQETNGVVMICTTVGKAEHELAIAGCVDTTKEVKEKLIRNFKGMGFDFVDHFEWDDTKGNEYWHVIKPGEIRA